MNNSKVKVRNITVIAVLSAVSVVLGLTPLGFIPIGAVKATTMHIPVIVGGIIEGPFVGAMVGLIFGLFSMVQAVTRPTPISFVFYNPLVAILPRVLIGLVSAYGYIVFKKVIKNDKIPIFITSIIASLTNTFGVLGSIYIFHGQKYASTLGISVNNAKKAIVAVGFTNGIPEALMAGLIVTAVVKAVRYENRR